MISYTEHSLLQICLFLRSVDCLCGGNGQWSDDLR